MTAPIGWFGVTADATVSAVGVLSPGRLAIAPDVTRLMVEVPGWADPPQVGWRLEVVPILAVWPDD